MSLNDLSPAALKAAMTGGTAGWGVHGSSRSHVRYSEPFPKQEWRRRGKCHCGCGKKETHLGMANGVSLMSGCELSVARWVRA